MALQTSLLKTIPLQTYCDLWRDSDIRNFSLFQMPWDTIIGNKFQFMVQLHIPTTVVDSWDYYEFEEYVKLLNEKNKDEEKQRKDDENKQKASTPNMGGFNPSKMMGSMPKMPSMPKF